jgi:hypothetical protein
MEDKLKKTEENIISKIEFPFTSIQEEKFDDPFAF